jgi:hypothetical protein
MPGEFGLSRIEKQESGTCAPLSSFLFFALAPVSFNQDPLTVTMNPLMRNPMRAGMGRTIPVAGGPHVMVPFIAVIAVDPHKPSLRGRAGVFDDSGRGADANDYLRIRCRGYKSESKQKSQCNLLYVH